MGTEAGIHALEHDIGRLRPWVEAPADAPSAAAAADDAVAAIAALCIDPAGLGGLRLQARSGPLRDLWLAGLRAAWPHAWPWRTLPGGIADDRLLGGIDLTATLALGRPVLQQGLLAECDGGLLRIPMAERLPAAVAARVALVLDTGTVQLAREGLQTARPSRFTVLALDESCADVDDADTGTGLPDALADRLGLVLRLEGPGPSVPAIGDRRLGAPALEAARARLPAIATASLAERAWIEALSEAAMALAIDSPRAVLAAWRCACALAAWRGHRSVQDADAEQAVRLSLLPKARRLPPGAAPAADPPPEVTPPTEPAPGAVDPEGPDPQAEPPDDSKADPPRPDPSATPGPPKGTAPPDPADRDEAPAPIAPADWAERLVEAAAASLAPGWLARLALAGQRSAGARSTVSPMRATTGGSTPGAASVHQRRGPPAGLVRQPPAAGQQVALIETLRAAAPWQAQRRQASSVPDGSGVAPGRLLVRAEDFHIRRLRPGRRTTTVFVVDASGSAALRRLAEAKGAVERLLAESYVRRDAVALVAFRGSGAQVLLPPTRSLARARRELSGLPGGGGTPLASGLAAATDLARGLLRKGEAVMAVLLTDGQANLDLQGRPGREAARRDAMAQARRWRGLGLQALLIDTSARPSAPARELADALGGAYLPLPLADAQRMSAAVSGALQSVRTPG